MIRVLSAQKSFSEHSAYVISTHCLPISYRPKGWYLGTRPQYNLTILYSSISIYMIIVDMFKNEVGMSKDKEILTAKEVADYLNLHPLTVHRYAREGKIPAFKIGTDWRFHKKYIERWIREKLNYNIQGKERRKLALDRV